jgi:DNA-binding PadR family transcriptional regulator
LEDSITNKLLALLTSKANVQKLIENPVRESEGLKQHEITMLLLILEHQMTDEHKVSGSRLQRDMESAGFTKVASNIAFRELKSKGFIEQLKALSEEGDPYTVFKLTLAGENWVMKNQDQIQFKRTPKQEDELPF